MLTDAPRVQVTDAALDYLTYYTRFPEANTDGAPCSRPSARPHERSSPRRSLERVYVYVCVSRALRGGERKGGTSSQEHHSWSAATTTQSAAGNAG